MPIHMINKNVLPPVGPAHHVVNGPGYSTRIVRGMDSGSQTARPCQEPKVEKTNLRFDPFRARLLRRRTTMSLEWVANQLRIDSWKYLSKMLSTQPASNGQLTFAEAGDDAKPIISPRKQTGGEPTPLRSA